MLNTGVAKHYAEAVLQLAVAEGKLDRWLDDLRTVAEVLTDPAITAILDSTAVPLNRKMSLVRQSLGWLEPTVLNLLLLLVERRRVALLGSIVAEFARLVDERRGIVDVRVTTAVALDTQQRHILASRLSRPLGRQVRLHVSVDPSIVGGLVVQVGDRVINASVAGRLEALRRSLVT